MGETSEAPSTKVQHVTLPKPSLLKTLQPANTYDLTKLSDERSQTIDKLLKKGHVTVAPLREPQLILHSHLPHVSGNFF